MNSACMRQRRWALPGAARASGTARAITLRVPAKLDPGGVGVERRHPARARRQNSNRKTHVWSRP